MKKTSILITNSLRVHIIPYFITKVIMGILIGLSYSDMCPINTTYHHGKAKTHGVIYVILEFETKKEN